MPALELEFEVYCRSCGEGLCNLSREGKTPGRGMPFIEVEACPNCVKKAYEEGFDRGKQVGYEDYENELNREKVQGV